MYCEVVRDESLVSIVSISNAYSENWRRNRSSSWLDNTFFQGFAAILLLWIFNVRLEGSEYHSIRGSQVVKFYFYFLDVILLIGFINIQYYEIYIWVNIMNLYLWPSISVNCWEFVCAWVCSVFLFFFFFVYIIFENRV